MQNWTDDPDILNTRVALASRVGQQNHALRPIPLYDMVTSMREHGHEVGPADMWNDEFFAALEDQAIDHVCVDAVLSLRHSMSSSTLL